MLQNYYYLAIRTIRINERYTLINMIGLSVGIMIFLSISLWVMDELSFDRFHEHADRIYRVCSDVNAGSRMRLAMSMPPLKEALLQDFPEVEQVVQIGFPRRRSVKIDDVTFQEDGVGWCDKDIFSVFSFHLIQGNDATALESPFSVIISQSTAKKYFDSEDPMGKILKIGDDTEYTVTGVFTDVPPNSHLQFNMLRSYATLQTLTPENMAHWMNIQYYTYIRLGGRVNAMDLEAKFPDFVDRHMGAIVKRMGGSVGFFLQPLASIHLHSRLMGEHSSNGSMTYVLLFSGIAFLILSLACINYINLATARSASRAREVGLLKTLGADKVKLVFQFLGESVFFSLISFLIALLLWGVTKPMFQTLVGRQLSYHLFKDIWLLPVFLCLALLVGLAAGAYPALYLSSFHPIKVLKSGFSSTHTKGRLRKSLVVFQFTVSILLLISTTAIYKQVHFMKNKNLGLQKENVLVIPDMMPIIRQISLETVRDAFLKVPGVIDVAGCFLMPSRSVGKGIYYPEGFTEDQPQTTNRMSMDAHLIHTLGMEIVAGRNFSKDLSTEQSESLIINEKAVQLFGWTDPVGKIIRLKDATRSSNEMISKRVVGIVKDFHSLSLHRPLEPLVISYNTNMISDLSIRMAPENYSDTMDLLEEKWKEVTQGKPFNYFFLDDSFDRMYRGEERIGTLALCFSGLAIFIGCLGLFGLVTFIAEKRAKEIGIRKVLGASVNRIIVLLSKEFIILNVIANLIAWPLAFISLNRWLQNFAFRMKMPWPIFLLAGCLAVFLGLMTMAYQTIKAARSNPVDAIQYE